MELTVWDLSVPNYRERAIPDERNNPYLRLVTEHEMWNEESTILDVGCGAGIYSVAFAKKCKKVVGMDVSGEMIAAAKENALRYGTPNTEFYQTDWHGFELSGTDWKGQFDLVFANMTPAVQSYHTLELMNEASRGWCFLSKPTEWKHSTTYELIKELGIWEKYRTFDMDMLCAFDVLRLQGRRPQLEYTTDIWESTHSLPEAYDFFIRRIEMKQLLTAEQKKIVCEYLDRKAVDGKIVDRTEVTIPMMYWRV